MATNGSLRVALLAKLGITPQALSLRVQTKKKTSPMSTEDAVYLIAHEQGIKIDRYLSKETVDRVRALVHQTQPVVRALPNVARTKAKSASKRPKEIRFSSNLKTADMLLPEAKLKEAREMAEVYPLLYVLENSMREIIKRVMTANYADGWWDTQLTTSKLQEIHAKAAGRKKSEKKWHQGRGAHPIDYVDLADLGTIVLGKSSLFFPSVLGDDVEWFRHFMKELEPSRNVVCHMNPLDENNIKGLQVQVGRWANLVKQAALAGPALSGSAVEGVK
jgi:Swt1-like HEPN